MLVLVFISLCNNHNLRIFFLDYEITFPMIRHIMKTLLVLYFCHKFWNLDSMPCMVTVQSHQIVYILSRF